MTRSLPRASAGLVVLAVAAVVLIGLNHGAGQRISGTPKASWPEPPAVGSCVNLDSGASSSVAEVPCSRPHDAEVTKSYSALDPVLSASPSASIDGACADASRSYLGYGASGVTPPLATGGWAWSGQRGDSEPSVTGDSLTLLDLAYSTSPVVAPQSERVADRGWQICVIQPEPAVRYLGSVYGATLTDAPDAFRTCWGGDGATEPVTCAGPHVYEVFGAAAGRISVPIVVSPPSSASAGPGATSGGGAALGGGSGASGASSGDDDVAAEQRAAALAAQQQRVWDEVQKLSGSVALAQALAEDMERASDAGQPADSAVTGQVDDATLALARQLLARHQKLTEQCRSSVAEAVGTADPTFGGSLAVELWTGAPSEPTGGAVTPPPGGQVLIGGDSDAPSGPTEYVVTMGTEIDYCVVATSVSRQLTRSLVGWGDAPLPLTGG